MLIYVQRLRTDKRTGPRPLEVVATQPARDVYHFANEVQPRLCLGFHGLLRQGAGVDAAQRHFSLFVAFGTGGSQFPARQLFGQPRQGFVGGLHDGALPVGAPLRPGVSQAAGYQGGEFVGDQLFGARLAQRQRCRAPTATSSRSGRR